MKRSWEGTKLTMDLEDGQPPIVTDIKDYPANIQKDFLAFGFQTKLRNYTAGKESDKAREAVLGGIKQLTAGEWGASTERVELSDTEKSAVVASYMVAQRRLRGDVRPEEQILTAYNALPADKKAAIEKKHEKGIKKAMSERLKAKKKGDNDEL
jgi:hypothetical protein